MKQIRSSVFETNSSSMHSLVIRSDDIINELVSSGDEIAIETPETMVEKFDPATYKGVLDLSYDSFSFGRHPFRILAGPYDKYLYAYTMYKVFESDKPNLAEEILKKYLSDIKEIKYPECITADEPYLFYWMKKYNISLEEFIINSKYVVIVDGDEYCIWDMLKGANIIDKNAIENNSQEGCYE